MSKPKKAAQGPNNTRRVLDALLERPDTIKGLSERLGLSLQQVKSAVIRLQQRYDYLLTEAPSKGRTATYRAKPGVMSLAERRGGDRKSERAVAARMAA